MALAVYITYRIYSGSAALKYSSRFKKNAVLALRSIALILLLLAFFDVKAALDYSGTNYIVVIDNSWSMKDNISKAVRTSSLMLEKLLTSPDSVAQYLSFGAGAAVEKINMDARKLYMRAPRAITKNNATNLEKALEFAAALAREDSENKILLFTDGCQTQGDYNNAAARLRGAGIEVYPFGFEQAASCDVILTSLKVPASNLINQKFEGRLTCELKNRDAMNGAQLRIYRDNALISASGVNLTRGFNTFKFNDSVDKVGYARYTAFIEGNGDANTHNNTMYAFTETSGTPRILIVSENEKAPGVISLFARSGYDISHIEPFELPANMEELMRYKLIVLNDVSFNDLKFKAVKSLKSYVTDFGGGLIIAGGDKSFGNGGYMATPLEDLAPVTMDIKDKAKVVSCAIIFVIDKSGSMSEMSTGFESDNMLKIDLAKEAVIASIQLLLPKDRIGVMAFDHDYKWVSMPVNASEKDDVIEKTAQLVADGGTSMYGALEEAFNEVKKEKVTTRHLVALTDGITERGDFDNLVAKFKQARVTLSCVALGRDADVPFLSSLAQKGGGRFYFCEEAGSLPSVFVQETLKSTRNLIVEEVFTPKAVNLNPLFTSIAPEKIAAMPKLKGYVASTIKPNAVLYLKSRNDDPLLATLQCGLGKSAGFMFDLYGRWSGEFAAWSEFGMLLENTIKFLLRPDFSSNITFSAERDGEFLAITAKTLDAQMKYINFLDSALTYTDAENNFKTAEVIQTRAGTYFAKVKLEKEGNYFFSLSQKGSNGESFHGVFGYSYPYSDEYVSGGDSRSVLENIASATGGRPIDENNFYDILSAKKNQLKTRRMPVRNYLLQIVIFMFLLEILLWRVDFSADMAAEIKKRISSAAAYLFPRPQKAGEHSESVGRLLHIKSRLKTADDSKDAAAHKEFSAPAGQGISNAGLKENKGALEGMSKAPESAFTPAADKNDGAQVKTPGTDGVSGDDEPGGFTKKLLKIKKPKR